MTEPLFDTIAIVGLGLIGSSIARAARAQGGHAGLGREQVRSGHHAAGGARLGEPGLRHDVSLARLLERLCARSVALGQRPPVRVAERLLGQALQ